MSAAERQWGKSGLKGLARRGCGGGGELSGQRRSEPGLGTGEMVYVRNNKQLAERLEGMLGLHHKDGQRPLGGGGCAEKPAICPGVWGSFAGS